ncbi:MAG TPA: hypothetical protein VFN61_03765 [Acidimicrobiales bacterium]|nr:hypothetical protein [Acidimicrobiales bacterium]
MQNHHVQQLTVGRAFHATQLFCGPRSGALAGSATNASLIAGMPGAAFTSKWYRNPERLMSPSERPPS